MADALAQNLRRHFSHTTFRPLQREIIESVLAGTPTLAILPTGAGKSLTYQLPALLLDGVSLVISPLISLIQDQTQELKRMGLPVGRLDSTLSPEERCHQLSSLRKGEFKLFYTSPESLANPALSTILRQIDISLIAIDEAHCISDWGHSFRPSYLYLPKVVRSLKPQSVLALTATATRKTASDIRKQFRIKTAQQFSSSHLRPNLKFKIAPCSVAEKEPTLLAALANQASLPAIVYATRQEQCEAIAHMLNAHGYKARSYHAGLNTKARSQIQNQFLADEINVVVATIAFGMGVNKPNIRSVIHYHLPKSPEGWMQESGRAGRDGLPSHCLLLACGDDVIPLENFIQAKVIRDRPLTKLIGTLFEQGKTSKLSPYHTRVQLDFHSSSLDIILARLEVSGHIKFTGTSWRYIWAWPVTGSRLDLTQFPKKLRSALEHIFQLGERYDTESVEADFSVSPAKLWKALLQLKEDNSIVCKTSGWFWHYQVKNSPLDAPTIKRELLGHLQKQTETELSKLTEVKKIATSRACIPNKLAQWFGEKANIPCGKCSSCLKEKRPSKLPQSNEPPVSDSQIESIHQLLDSPKNRIRTNQQLTRFLCGIPSPFLRHYWLTKNTHFGLLSGHHYTDVQHYAKAILNAAD
ncbi:MAG: RecQ family ATP-dependent DNA helicase [Rubritalea sp.]|uniref:RecQ family ATP-dependent DNA helicase n=1 Tax=Rubritalea sp. TaxID=2109375 RepID=UPI0032421746